MLASVSSRGTWTRNRSAEPRPLGFVMPSNRAISLITQDESFALADHRTTRCFDEFSASTMACSHWVPGTMLSRARKLLRPRVASPSRRRSAQARSSLS